MTMPETPDLGVNSLVFAGPLEQLVTRRQEFHRNGDIRVHPDPKVEAVRKRDWPIKMYYSIMREVRDAGGMDILDIGSSVEVNDEETAMIEPIIEYSHQESIAAGKYSQYPSSWGDPLLRRSLVRLFQHYAGIKLDETSEVMVTGGIIKAIDTAFQAFDISHVILPSLAPYFVGSLATLRGKQIVEMPLDLKTGNFDLYTLDSRLKESGASPGKTLMYITLPSAPAGTLPEDDFIEKELIPYCLANQIPIISDSYIYATTFTGKPIRLLLSYKDAKKVAIESVTTSKELGLPGVRIGGIGGHPGMMDVMRLYAASALDMLATPNQNLAAHAFHSINPDITARRLAKELQAEILPRLQKMNWPVVIPQAGLDMILKVPESFMAVENNDPSLLASIDLLLKYGVAFCPLSTAYGSDGNKWLRMVLKQADGKIPQALDRMIEMGFDWNKEAPTEELLVEMEKLIGKLDLTKL